MGERLACTEEVESSILSGSTIKIIVVDANIGGVKYKRIVIKFAKSSLATFRGGCSYG